MKQFSRQFMKFSRRLEMLSPKTPNYRVGWGLKKIIDFLGSPWHFQDFWIFDTLKSPLGPLGWGGFFFFLIIYFLGSSWHFPDFWICDPLNSPWHPPGVWWVKFFKVRISPISNRICVPNLVALRRSWMQYWYDNREMYENCGIQQR